MPTNRTRRVRRRQPGGEFAWSNLDLIDRFCVQKNRLHPRAGSPGFLGKIRTVKDLAEARRVNAAVLATLEGR